MKIACVLGPGFEDSEYEEPTKAFKQAGHEVTVIGLKAGEQLKGDKGKVTATTDIAVTDVKPEQFDALLIPGGHSPDKLRADEKMVEFVRTFVDSKKPVFAICHGPQLLLSADRYKGKQLTAWKTVQSDLQKAGGDVVDKEVVVDGKLVTSRMPSDLPAFIEQSLKILQTSSGEKAA